MHASKTACRANGVALHVGQLSSEHEPAPIRRWASSRFETFARAARLDPRMHPCAVIPIGTVEGVNIPILVIATVTIGVRGHPAPLRPSVARQ